MLAFLAFVDQLPQLAVMKPNGGSWTVLTSDREHGYITTAAWAPDGSKIYYDRMWGHPQGIYFGQPLGGEPRMLLGEAFGPESIVKNCVEVCPKEIPLVDSIASVGRDTTKRLLLGWLLK